MSPPGRTGEEEGGREGLKTTIGPPEGRGDGGGSRVETDPEVDRMEGTERETHTRVCCEGEREKEREKDGERERYTLSLLFSSAKSRRRSGEREAGAVARGSVRAARWTEGKMDRELDLPNLPPR